MNEEARLILIQRAISNNPIAYSAFLEQLGYDSPNISLLHSILDDIARFESENNRPPLTVMAKRLDKDEWGNGFYDLCIELGLMDKYEHNKKAFAKKMQKQVHEYWVSNKENLIKRKTPTEGYNEIPIRTFDFQGVDINWEEQNRNLAKIGQLGEELVIEYEKKILKANGKDAFANEVIKVKDGEGYDIFSRNFDGSEKKIEVKTTTANYNKEFQISLTELKFSELNSNSYYLYRLFNLNPEKRVAEFHEYKGNLNEHFYFEGINFNAFKKNK
ncbi:MAG: DUF3883 domain-containing protein [Flavobacterium sp.]|nr:DUF3883 domain-containing protein [Flavobacterium sp.]MDP3928915.1 DUF3883 domain-containing protein [Bacteroidota bacterium]